MIHFYTLVLANNDNLYIEDKREFEEYKKYLSENPFVEIKRKNTTQRIGRTTYFRPEIASYKTDSIVYIEDTTQDRYNSLKKQAKYLREKNKLIQEIQSYKYNFEMKWWFKRHGVSKKNSIALNYNNDFLKDILNACKRYHCTQMSEPVWLYNTEPHLKITADLLQAHMINRGYLSGDIAKELECTTTVIEDFFQYKKIFSYPELEKFCNIIGLDKKVLFEKADYILKEYENLK